MTPDYLKEQKKPMANQRIPVWDLVLSDIKERNLQGIQKYGSPLQAFNGRNPLIDAYQKALDLVVYLRQTIEEQKLKEQPHE